MNYIGEFQKDSTILLELLTKDEKNLPIPTDFSPTATIEFNERNGLQVVDSVKLETMGDSSQYSKSYKIPSHWKEGEYLVTYTVTVAGKQHKLQEKFNVVEALGFAAQAITSPTTPNSDDDEEYVLPSDFGVQTTTDVQGNKLIITLAGNVPYNNTYRVVLGKGITSVGGNVLATRQIIEFTSEYGPLFATVLEVRSILKSMSQYYSQHEMYSAIRDAGQKAMSMLGRVADPNNSRYRAMRETETILFPTQKYVIYEAARALLASLIVQLLNPSGDGSGGGLTSTTSAGSIQLGDFKVDAGSSSTGTGGSSSKEESPLRKLQALMGQVELEIKFWQDRMMGHNKRGYAKPVSSSFRTAGGTPTGRDFA